MSSNKPATESSSLGHMPNGIWTFDQRVTDVFEDMLHRSIPQYEVMRSAVFGVGRTFVQPGTWIVDLGSSKGDALAPFVREFGERNRYLGTEISLPMLRAARERFVQEIGRGQVTMAELDLRHEYPAVRASLTLCVLSLQFIPIEYRQRVLSDAFANTAPGGALVLVEKVLGRSAGINALMIDLYHRLKSEVGYSAEEIERKRASLEGALVPLTAQWNEQCLRGAGFRDVDCFWRWMNFAGWIAIKPGC